MRIALATVAARTVGIAFALVTAGCTPDGGQPEARAEPAAAASPAPSPGPKPKAVEQPNGADRDRWRKFAARQWWLEGDDVACDGRMEARPVYGALSQTMGEGHVCHRNDGESVAWWKRGDRACPAGTRLVGAPPPTHNALMCMSPADKPDGNFTFWYERGGGVEGSGQRRDGALHGLEVRLDEGGRLRDVSTHDAGKLHGPMFTYINGKLAARAEYEQGVLQGLTTAWHMNGTVARQSPYVDGKLHGDVISWGDDGTHCGTQTFEAGTGTMTRYWKNCRVHETGRMVDGRDEGAFKYFDADGRPTAPPKR